MMALSVPAVPYLNCSLSRSDSCVGRPSEADRACGWPQSQISRSASAESGESKPRAGAAPSVPCVRGAFGNAVCVCRALGVSGVGLLPR